MPIFLADGSFFGTLCAIDPKPHRLNTPETLDMFGLFAQLIAFHLTAAEKLTSSQADLLNERKTSELREQFIAILGHDLRNPHTSIAAVARRFRKAKPSEDAAEQRGPHGRAYRQRAGFRARSAGRRSDPRPVGTGRGACRQASGG
jgi:K+-sensing histidine kinase KdpD